ncbi:MAG TPA: hypothetical protein VMI75_01355, partial [Polyangiaceae bacterium]|nr:hypothetical protein [Polyangiaceae bacterium]
ADSMRARLSERDALIFSVWGPKDLTPTRLGELPSKLPEDAEVRFIVARYRVEDRVQRDQLLDEAIAIDPRFAGAWQMKGETLLDDNEYEKADQAYRKCMSISGSALCIQRLALIAGQLGRCPEMETLARYYATASPKDPPLEEFAIALAAQGQPRQTVADALALRNAGASDKARRVLDLVDRANVAAWTGDFVDADAQTEALEKTIGELPDLAEFECPRVRRIRIALETGRPRAAARLAVESLRKRVASPGAEPSMVPYLWAVAARGGAPPPVPDPRANRGAWRELMNGLFAKRDVWEAWVRGYAMPATTRAEAEDALASRGDFPPFWGDNQHEWEAPQFEEGRVRLLAGHPEDALADLRFEAKSCFALIHPFDHPHANLELGHALEATGDVEGACAAFRVVVDRWGSAKPRSVSAEDARARIAALHCP